MQPQSPSHAGPTARQWLNWTVRILLFILILDGVLFGIAGRLD